MSRHPDYLPTISYPNLVRKTEGHSLQALLDLKVKDRLQGAIKGFTETEVQYFEALAKLIDFAMAGRPNALHINLQNSRLKREIVFPEWDTLDHHTIRFHGGEYIKCRSKVDYHKGTDYDIREEPLDSVLGRALLWEDFEDQIVQKARSKAGDLLHDEMVKQYIQRFALNKDTGLLK